MRGVWRDAAAWGGGAALLGPIPYGIRLGAFHVVHGRSCVNAASASLSLRDSLDFGARERTAALAFSRALP
ncbi:hypothetical protein, partial [Paenibacillus forsythiae]